MPLTKLLDRAFDRLVRYPFYLILSATNVEFKNDRSVIHTVASSLYLKLPIVSEAKNRCLKLPDEHRDN